MKDGHPYETEELDELRATQRRTLRSIPTRFLMEMAARTDFVPPEPGPDDALAEVTLRRRAARKLEALGESERDTLDKLGAESSLVAAEAALAPTSAALRAVSGDPRKDVYIADVEEEARDALVNDISTARHSLSEIVFLLRVSDALAGDYTDPRLVGRDPLRA